MQRRHLALGVFLVAIWWASIAEAEQPGSLGTVGGLAIREAEPNWSQFARRARESASPKRLEEHCRNQAATLDAYSARGLGGGPHPIEQGSIRAGGPV
jgi:hypothetical protein